MSEFELDDAETENPFEERADDIAIEHLDDWHVPHPFFSRIQEELVAPGARLFVGPRGCGKTHQIRLAHNRCRQLAKAPFGVYVSFARYFWLEPRLGETSDAKQVFQGWVLAKIIEGVADEFDERLEALQAPASDEELADFITAAEKGLPSASDPDLLSRLSIDRVKALLVDAMRAKKKRRVVLFLDDAALTLTPEFLVEFFEIFRNLKARNIAPKASVYPGTTEYGPRMHVGQDASEVPCWISVEDDSYLEFMRKVLDRRASVSGETDAAVDLLAYAAFGLPRAFLSLFRAYRTSTAKTQQQKLTNVMRDRCKLMQQEYLSLSKKAPQYKTIIETGWSLFDASIKELVTANGKASPKRKQLTVGIEREGETGKSRMLQLLKEVGLVYELSDVSHGDDRQYWRLIPHLLFLLAARGLNRGRGFSPADIVTRLRKAENQKHPMRRKLRTLIPDLDEASFSLDAPSCTECGAVRLVPEQRFCATCGAQLVRESAFRKCMQVPLGEIGLPSRRVARIHEESDLRTIGDLLGQAAPATALQNVNYISEKRSAHTYQAVLRFVEEYLER